LDRVGVRFPALGTLAEMGVAYVIARPRDSGLGMGGMDLDCRNYLFGAKRLTKEKSGKRGTGTPRINCREVCMPRISGLSATAANGQAGATVAEESPQVAESGLVERVRHGDKAAYGELVRRYEKKLVRTLYRMVGNAETAEDLTQEAFLKAYNRLEQFDTGKRFGPWLFQIGVNGAIDWLRRNRKRYLMSLNEMMHGEREFDVADADPRGKLDLAQEVHYLLAQIPVKYRTVLMLRDIEGFPCSEVAAIIGREEPTVRWRLIKAREQFRQLWESRERS
jgi:RNA polymerase sigma-70 factor (ECF subfamily)